MSSKPPHLADRYAAQWEDATMAEDYPNRAPYPDATFDILVGLLRGESGRVLDLGCGTGDVARPLSARVKRVDAVDRSAEMLAMGRRLPGGDRVHWVHARAEETDLERPYALITAGASIHWLPLDELLPRLTGERLALVERESAPRPWLAPVKQVVGHYSTNADFQPYDPFGEITDHPQFQCEGEARTKPVVFEQPAAAYLSNLHSRNGLSRARMGDAAAAFDREVLALIPDPVRIEITGFVRWGTIG